MIRRSKAAERYRLHVSSVNIGREQTGCVLVFATLFPLFAPLFPLCPFPCSAFSFAPRRLNLGLFFSARLSAYDDTGCVRIRAVLSELERIGRNDKVKGGVVAIFSIL